VKTRRKSDKDFREGAVRLVRETGKPIAEVVSGQEAAGIPGVDLAHAVTPALIMRQPTWSQSMGRPV
jgi:hypothetical protein